MKLCIISSSVAPMDYSQKTPVTLEFGRCHMTRCHYIPIVDDDIFESNETFYVTVTLEETAGMDKDEIKLDPVNGTIHIVNDDTLRCKHT